MNAVDDLLRADSAHFTDRNEDLANRIQKARSERLLVERRLLEYRDRVERSATVQTRSLRSRLSTIRRDSRLSEHRNEKVVGRLAELVRRIVEDVEEDRGGGNLVFAKRKYWEYVARVYPSWRELCERNDRRRVEELERELTHLNLELEQQKSQTERENFRVKESIHQKKSELMSKRAQINAESRRLARGVRESVVGNNNDPEEKVEDKEEEMTVVKTRNEKVPTDPADLFQRSEPVCSPLPEVTVPPEPRVVQEIEPVPAKPDHRSQTEGNPEANRGGNKKEVEEENGSRGGVQERRGSSGSSINSDKPLPSLPPLASAIPSSVTKFVRFAHDEVDDDDLLSSVEILAGSSDDSDEEEGEEEGESKCPRNGKEEEEDGSFSLDVSSLS